VHSCIDLICQTFRMRRTTREYKTYEIEFVMALAAILEVKVS
jgi:hypothetical protein